MKKYEKPCLTAISLSGNDQLCGSCAGGKTLFDDPTFAASILEKLYPEKIKDGVQADDFKNIFSLTESCKEVVVGYCKFNSQNEGSKLVAWS